MHFCMSSENIVLPTYSKLSAKSLYNLQEICKNEEFRSPQLRTKLMLTHYNNNGIHCKIYGNSIHLMLNHLKNNNIHRKVNGMCIAWVLIRCKNNGILSKSAVCVLP